MNLLSIYKIRLNYFTKTQVLTGQTNVELAIDAINKGNIYRFITKPWNDRELKIIISQAVAQYDLVQENERLQTRIILQNVALQKMNEKLEEKIKERTRLIMEQKEKLIKFNRELEQKVSEKTEQLRLKDIKLLEMDRIVGVATLAAGIAHEINSPLSFFKSSIGSLKRDVNKIFGALKYWDDKPVPEELLKDYHEYLSKINYSSLMSSFDKKFERIKIGIQRIIKIVNSLKSISRVDMEGIGEIDINQTIEEVIEVLNDNGLKKVEFVKELQELPHIECNVEKINQCLLHAVKDGIDAIDGTGTIIIKTFFSKEDGKVII